MTDIYNLEHGDSVDIVLDKHEYPKLFSWMLNHNGECLVDKVDYESELVFLQGCKYAVRFDYIR